MPDVVYAEVTWEQLHRDARALADLARQRGPFCGIVAVTRGGLVPAAIVARELDCRLIESICVVAYDGEERNAGAPRVVKGADAAGDGTGFLIVDDLVDRGDTARAVRNALPRAIFACLYAKRDGLPCADLYVTEVPQKTWLVFPWDVAPAPVAP
jgi:xanthine phosphoribosyltransferase